mgnify:CR=1 FL=1
MSAEEKSISIIVTKGSLDWAYPPFILATTAAAMGLPVTLFFTFYGLPLLLKKLDLQLTAAGNPAMKMPMMSNCWVPPRWLKSVKLKRKKLKKKKAKPPKLVAKNSFYRYCLCRKDDYAWWLGWEIPARIPWWNGSPVEPLSAFP